MDEQTFTQAEVHKVFPHISPRTLKSWVVSGLVGWTEKLKDKRGIHRVYTRINLMEFAVVAELSELNFQVQMIKGMLGSLAPLKENLGRILAVYKLYAHDIEGKTIGGIQSFNHFDPAELEIHRYAYRHSPYIVEIKLPEIAQRVDYLVKGI
jgi:hypothetical protein